jgi:hypothetical protein
MPLLSIILQIDNQISRLQQARALLAGTDSDPVQRRRGRPIGSGAAKSLPAGIPKALTRPRKMTAAGRKRIADAMKERWAKVRTAAKAATTTTPSAVAPKVSAKKSAKKTPARKAGAKKSVAKKTSPALASA